MIGATYIHNMGYWLYPFIGGKMGPGFSFPKKQTGDESRMVLPDVRQSFNLHVPFGVLLAVNQQFAIQLGASFAVQFGIRPINYTSVQFDFGYLGVSSFF